VVAISCCSCLRTVHALLGQGEGQEGKKRLGSQPSHVTSGSARYKYQRYLAYFVLLLLRPRELLSGAPTHHRSDNVQCLNDISSNATLPLSIYALSCPSRRHTNSTEGRAKPPLTTLCSEYVPATSAAIDNSVFAESVASCVSMHGL
jgi:hypothetical protein